MVRITRAMDLRPIADAGLARRPISQQRLLPMVDEMFSGGRHTRRMKRRFTVLRITPGKEKESDITRSG